MSQRVVECLSQKSVKRRPTRFHAVVEALDTRQLMASGVTGTTLTYDAPAGGPLLPELLMPVPPDYYTIVPTVPVLTLSSSTGSLSTTDYSGTINWGDGSPLDTAQFSTDTVPTHFTLLSVMGPNHTYQNPGHYTITVSVTGPGDSAPTAYHDTANIGSAMPSITGQLDPSSDSGASHNDLVTAVTTPNFFGTTEPGAIVFLYATSRSRLDSALQVGTSVADSSGRWSITTVPFVDGAYTINASALGSQTGTPLAGAALTTPSQPLVIDTAGPQIEGFQITNSKKGTFQVGFFDPNGLVVGPLTNPNTYVVEQTSPSPRKGQTFAVANLAISTVPGGITGPETVAPALVMGTIVSNKPIGTGNRTITFTLKAAGITSLSGIPLDGKYTGKLPTGNGRPGGDFQVKVNIRDGKASGPIAITPITPKTTHIVKAKSVVKHHA